MEAVSYLDTLIFGDEDGAGAGAGKGASEQQRSPSSRHGKSKKNKPRPHLPVLIIPGFMSSGLEIQKSMHEPWVGKRLWLNLVSLGLGGYFDEDTVHNRSKNDNNSSRREGVDEADDSFNDAGDSQCEGDEDAEEDPHLARHKKKFLSHLSLRDDMRTEHPDIEVRAMEGLAGVDYLTSRSITHHVSYVFGPVIRALKKVGYEEGINLAGAPYDWRIPPSELERRDAYFTKTMTLIEELYDSGGGMPVVLLCHSLGCRVGHYMLDFANAKDPTWCDRYVHTYMPVGAPHLGAPKPLRAIVTGDKMGLPFLKDQEALALGRSFGSGLWLIPGQLPFFAPANAFVRREGAFQIAVRSTIDLGPLLEERIEDHMPAKLALTLRYGTETLSTGLAPVEEEGDGTKVTFEGKFTFSTGPDGPYAKRCCACTCCWGCCGCCVLCCACCPCCSNNTLIVSLGELGLSTAKRTKSQQQRRKQIYSESDRLMWLKVVFCWYVIKWVLLFVWTFMYYLFFKTWVLWGDCINKSSNKTTWMACGEPIVIEEFVGETNGRDVDVELRGDWQKSRCRRKKMDVVSSVRVNIRWIPPEPMNNHSSTTCQLAEPTVKTYRRIGTLTSRQDKETWEYDESSGYSLLRKEENETALATVKQVYDSDPLAPRNIDRAPPVKNVKAIYGINLPTEVGAVYKRRKAVMENRREVTSMHKLDLRANFGPNGGQDGFVVEDGIVLETKDTPQLLEGPSKFNSSAIAKEGVRCSGDGTVPYWSLQFCRKWSKQCHVSVSELDGAEHRAILADSRFHKILIDYIATSGDEADEQV